MLGKTLKQGIWYLSGKESNCLAVITRYFVCLRALWSTFWFEKSLVQINCNCFFVFFFTLHIRYIQKHKCRKRIASWSNNKSTVYLPIYCQRIGKRWCYLSIKLKVLLRDTWNYRESLEEGSAHEPRYNSLCVVEKGIWTAEFRYEYTAYNNITERNN